MDQRSDFDPEREATGAAQHKAGQLLWEQALDQLKRVFAAADFERWIANLKLVAEKDGDVIIAAADRLTCDRVNADYANTVQRVWKTIDPKARNLKFLWWRALTASDRLAIGNPWAEPAPVVPVSAPVDDAEIESDATGAAPAMTFQTLVTGPSNDTAAQLARRIALGQPAGTPVVLFYGPPGTGKTHIAQALRALAQRTRPDCRVVYLTAEEFLAAYQEGVKARDTIELKRRLKSAHVLIIDDLHRIAGKAATENELFQNLREVKGQGGMVVLIGDVSPGDPNGFGQGMRSELRGAVSVEIGLPNGEMRREIVRRLIAHIEVSHPLFHLGEAEIDALVAGVRGPGRELVGAVWNIFTDAGFGAQAPTPEHVSAVLKRLAGSQRQPSIDEIKRAVRRLFKLEKGQLESASKAQSLVHPRQLAMYLCRQMTGKSLKQIGNAFGDRDHATVLYAINRTEEKIAKTPEVTLDLRRITDAIDEQGETPCA